MATPSAHRFLFALALSVLFATPLSAAPPEVRAVDIRGLRVGGTVTLTLDGANLLPNPRLLTIAPIVKQVVREGALPGRVALDITLAESAQPGVYAWWFVTDEGVSARDVLTVDALVPQPFAAKIDSLPAALHGTLSGGAVRETVFAGKAGQEIICEVEAQRLGGGLRPVLHLYGPSGALLKWSLPAPALRGDTRMEMRLPVDGNYTVHLRDLQFAAPAPNHFRLKIGQWQYADMAFPPAVRRGSSVELELLGNAPARPISLPASFEGETMPAPWPDAKIASGLRPSVQLTDLTELIEKRDGTAPQHLPALPVAVSGRLEQPGEEDTYRLSVTPETEVQLEIFADRLGALLDTTLTLRDEKNATLASNDDGVTGSGDSKLVYKVPKAVTNLVAAIRDVHGRGDRACLYRLKITRTEPEKTAAGFSLSIKNDAFALPAGRAQVLRVEARRQGYDGPIALAFDRLPAGVKVTSTDIPAGATGALLTFIADAPQLPLVTALRGKGGERESTAINPDFAAGRHQPWLAHEFAVASVAKPTVDFTLNWATNNQPVPLGGKLALALRCARPLGHDGAVRLTLLTSQGAPVNPAGQPDVTRALRQEAVVQIAADTKAQQTFDAIAVAEKALEAADKAAAAAKDDATKAATAVKLKEAQTKLDEAKKAAQTAVAAAKNDAAFSVLVPADLPELPHQFAFKAELLRRDGRTVEAVAFTPVRVLPVINPLIVKWTAPKFEIKLDAKTGAALELVGKLERLEGAKGEATLTLTGLPAGIAVPRVTLKDGETDFKLPLKFPAGFAAGEVKGVKAIATGKFFAGGPDIRSRGIDAIINLIEAEPEKKPAATTPTK